MRKLGLWCPAKIKTKPKPNNPPNHKNNLREYSFLCNFFFPLCFSVGKCFSDSLGGKGG